MAACERFADLLPVTKRVLGPDHPDAQATRSDLARWQERVTGTAVASGPDGTL
ncbi:hypothetical protein ACFWYW_23435 [Nonomuraea sp. NPDC059023]|uniref:hypothetical protein n=1 Tax=unclassified Nonomuraea TaxID=2593643 RepID=UPI0036C925D7